MLEDYNITTCEDLLQLQHERIYLYHIKKILKPVIFEDFVRAAFVIDKVINIPAEF